MTVITTAAGLQNMDLDLTDDYELGNNINCSGIANFEPVGGWGGAAAFTGTFDGKGYRITGLTVNRAADDYIGLFGETDGATIQNVTIEATITGDDNVGILAGSTNGGIFTDITVSGTVIGDTDVGGMLGETNDSEVITNCVSSGSVTGTSDTGGLIGETNGGETLIDCHSSCSLSAGDTAGGLIGGAYGDATITRCYATGNLVATGDDIGGLIGDTSYTTLSRCYATGNITSSDTTVGYLGGLVGFAPGYVGDGDGFTDCYSTGNITANNVGGSHEIGGFIGRNYGYLRNCYSIGLLTAAGAGNLIGGLVGRQEAGASTTACFWDKTTSGEADAVGDGLSTGITGRTTAQMKDLNTIIAAGWSIPSIWNVSPGCNGGYPCLVGVNLCCSSSAVPSVDPTIAPKKVSLELIRNIEMMNTGRFYIDKSGNAVYESRFAR